MRRFVALSVFTLMFCAPSLGFMLEDHDGKGVDDVVISVRSEAERAVFLVHFESETALSVTTEDAVTPMTFTVKAENFSGVVRPKGNVPLKVEVTQDGPDASRTSSTPTRIAKQGGNLALSRAESN